MYSPNAAVTTMRKHTEQKAHPTDQRRNDRAFRVRHSPRSVVVAVAAAAAAINALSFCASQLWVSPDASYYVELAGGIADKLDFRSELFLIRPPEAVCRTLKRNDISCITVRN